MELNKSTEKIVGMICKLEPQEFIGVCKILGVKIYEEVEGESDVDDFAPGSLRDAHNDADAQTIATAAELERIKIRQAEDLIPEVIEKITQLNRTQRRNLTKLLKPAVKGR